MPQSISRVLNYYNITRILKNKVRHYTQDKTTQGNIKENK